MENRDFDLVDKYAKGYLDGYNKAMSSKIQDVAAKTMIRFPMSCRNGHAEIIHGELQCPMCEMMEEYEKRLQDNDNWSYKYELLEDEYEDLEREKDALEMENDELNEEIDSIKYS